MELIFSIATPDDVPEITLLRNSVADDLTLHYGNGHWSYGSSEKGVLTGISNTSRILLARSGDDVVGTLRIAQKKPWAIDVSYFTPAKRPLYLLDMAVAPNMQRKGIGRRLMLEALQMAGQWPGDAIRLDAYDSPAGAGGFYLKCSFRETGRVVYRTNPLIYFEYVLL